MAEPTCWARTTLHTIDYAVARGADRQALRARIGLAGPGPLDPDARLPVSTYYATVEAVAEALADPFFGVHYIDQIEPSSIDAVGFLAMASQTLGESVRRIIRHHPMMTEGEVFHLEEVGDRAVVRYVPWGPRRPAHRHTAEMYAADFFVLAARMTGGPIEPLSFEMANPPGGPAADYHRLFGAVPTFDAPANRWSFDRAVLDRPMPHADPGLVRFFDGYLADRGRRVPASGAGLLRERVRDRLCQAMPDGALSLAAVARDLRLSARTLQRHLAGEGTTLAAVLDELRRERATVYLDMDLPAAEVSYLLGFAEPPVFYRAFKRWTGKTPQAWRAGRRRPAGEGGGGTSGVSPTASGPAGRG
jgi:AraC-like DNA-binding protein